VAKHSHLAGELASSGESGSDDVMSCPRGPLFPTGVELGSLASRAEAI
jgi:hypothetical protein